MPLLGFQLLLLEAVLVNAIVWFSVKGLGFALRGITGGRLHELSNI